MMERDDDLDPGPAAPPEVELEERRSDTLIKAVALFLALILVTSLLLGFSILLL